MDATRTQRAAALFKMLLDRPAREVHATLASLDDDGVRQLVQSWLQADANTDNWLDDAAGVTLQAHDVRADAEPLAPGTRIDAFTVVRTLGSGGMGTVYLARQDRPAREVALKVLHPWQRGPQVIERFRFEADALARLADPAIPQVYASGDADGMPWIAMERVHGLTLADWVQQRGWEVCDRLRLACAIAAAVGRAHDAGLVHRDLKPDNVLVSSEGDPKLLDFGVSMGTDADDKVRAQRVGSPQWSSPEQRAGQPATPASDVWALGVVTWHLVVGHRPFDRVERTEPDLSTGGLAVPPDLRHVVAKAVAADPAQRYPHAAQMAADLQAAMHNLPVRAVPWTPQYALQCWSRRHRTTQRWMAGLGTVVAGVAIVLTLQHQAQTKLRALRAQQDLHSILPATTPTDAASRAEVTTRLAAFLATPTHLGTPAASEAWRRTAAYAAQPEAQLDALARAYATAVNGRQQQRALADTIDHQLARWAWHEAATAADLLEDLGGHVPIRTRIDLHIATHDLAAARRLMAPDDPRLPLLQALDGLQPLPHDGGPLPVGDRLFLVSPQVELIEVTPNPPYDRIQRWPLDDVNVIWPRTHLVDQDGLWLFAPPRDEGGTTTVWRLDDAGKHATGTIAERRVARVTTLPDQPQGTVLVGTGPYQRRLSQAVLQDGTWTSHPIAPHINGLGSDISDIAVGQLDDDPELEVLVAQGPWDAYGVGRLDLTPDRQVHPGGELLLGFVNDVAFLTTPEGPRAVALKSDRYASPRVFGTEAPYGQPAGLYLLAGGDDGLAMVDHLALPTPPGRAHDIGYVHVFPGDLDGDPFTDLAVLVDLDDAVFTWLLRPLPQGGFAQILLPGFVVSGLFDVDGDGLDEILARQGGPQGPPVVLGAGASRLTPTAPPPQGHEDDEPLDLQTTRARQSLSQADVLTTLGMTGRAAAHLAEAARATAPLDAALLLHRAAHLSHSLAQSTPELTYLHEARAALRQVPEPPGWLEVDLARRVHAAALRVAQPQVALAAARTLADADPAMQAEVARLEALLATPVWSWGMAGLPWSDHARIRTPGAVRTLAQQGLHIDIPNQAAPSLDIPLTEPAPRLGMSVAFDVTRVDAAVASKVAFTSQDRPIAGLGIQRQGEAPYGLFATCTVGDQRAEDIAPNLLFTKLPAVITAEIEIVGDRIRCRMEVNGHTVEGHRSAPAQAASIDGLAIGDSSTGDYAGGSSALSSLHLRSLSLWGALPLLGPGPQSPDWQVAQGTPLDCPAPDVSPATCLHASILQGDDARATALIRRMQADPDQARTLRHAMRFHAPYALRAFRQALDAQDLAELVAGSWRGTIIHAPSEQVVTEVDHPLLDQAIARTESLTVVQFQRARALGEVGAWQRALTILEHLDTPATPQAVPPIFMQEVRFLQAAMLAQLDRWPEARHIADTLLAQSPYPEAARRRLARHPLLSRLVSP